MKVKIFAETNEEKLEKKANDFIANQSIKVLDVDFTGAGWALWPTFAVMITYEEL